VIANTFSISSKARIKNSMDKCQFIIQSMFSKRTFLISVWRIRICKMFSLLMVSQREIKSILTTTLLWLSLTSSGLNQAFLKGYMINSHLPTDKVIKTITLGPSFKNSETSAPEKEWTCAGSVRKSKSKIKDYQTMPETSNLQARFSLKNYSRNSEEKI
jgi:hypothetical protein